MRERLIACIPMIASLLWCAVVVYVLGPSGPFALVVVGIGALIIGFTGPAVVRAVRRRLDD